MAYSDVKNASICEWILDNDTGDSTRMLTVFEDMTASNAESDATIGVSARQARAARCILNDRICTIFALRDKTEDWHASTGFPPLRFRSAFPHIGGFLRHTASSVEPAIRR